MMIAMRVDPFLIKTKEVLIRVRDGSMKIRFRLGVRFGLEISCSVSPFVESSCHR